MISSRPIDYLAIGLALAAYEDTDKITNHSLTVEQWRNIFRERAGATPAVEFIEGGLHRLVEIGLATVVEDPYADTLFLLRDADLRTFCNSEGAAGTIYKKAWDAELEWLATAFARQKFWEDVALEEVDQAQPVPIVPSADGFVTINHNSEVAEQLEKAVSEADEAVRTANSIDEPSRTWVRGHLDAAISLIKRGGQILKNALKALVVEPLRAALKFVAEERAKELIAAAVKFVLSLF